MEDKTTLTSKEVTEKYNWARTTLQAYLNKYDELRACSKIVFGRRIFDKNKLEAWYNEMTKI
jgi:hypothetical protein